MFHMNRNPLYPIIHSIPAEKIRQEPQAKNNKTRMKRSRTNVVKLLLCFDLLGEVHQHAMFSTFTTHTQHQRNNSGQRNNDTEHKSKPAIAFANSACSTMRHEMMSRLFLSRYFKGNTRVDSVSSIIVIGSLQFINDHFQRAFSILLF